MNDLADVMIPDFRGRVVCIVFANKSLKDGTYIVDPYFEIQGGQLFLVGTLPDRWLNLSGNTVAVRWDRVESYMVADTIDEFLKVFDRDKTD